MTLPIGDIYQEVILDHNKNPRNFKVVTEANAYSHGHNPLCGDDYHLFLKIDNHGLIQDIGFQGQGCAISKSSASMMTTKVKGMSIKEAEKLTDHFIEMVTRECLQERHQALGNLMVFEGVRKFPIRVKCATLIWRTLQDAIKNQIQGLASTKPHVISTE
jgi:nitrogen fixation NifU-like protein